MKKFVPLEKDHSLYNSSNINIDKIESDGIVRDPMNMIMTSAMRHPIVVCKLADSGNSEVLVSKMNRLSFFYNIEFIYLCQGFHILHPRCSQGLPKL